MRYMTIVNHPNRIATVHRTDCAHIGNHPDTTASSERPIFDDGFEALKFAHQQMPERFGLCGHCQKDLLAIVQVKR